MFDVVADLKVGHYIFQIRKLLPQFPWKADSPRRSG
jgi:hypothetical protein